MKADYVITCHRPLFDTAHKVGWFSMTIGLLGRHVPVGYAFLGRAFINARTIKGAGCLEDGPTAANRHVHMFGLIYAAAGEEGAKQLEKYLREHVFPKEASKDTVHAAYTIQQACSFDDAYSIDVIVFTFVLLLLCRNACTT